MAGRHHDAEHRPGQHDGRGDGQPIRPQDPLTDRTECERTRTEDAADEHAPADQDGHGVRLPALDLEEGDGEPEERLVERVEEERDQRQQPHSPIAEARADVGHRGGRFGRGLRTREVLSGQRGCVREGHDRGDDERDPPGPPQCRRPGQEQRPDEVADLGAEVAGSEDPHQVVAGQVDEGDLAGSQHGVRRDAQQQRPHGQHPPVLPQAPAGQAEPVAERAERGQDPPAHPVGGDAGQPSHEPAHPHHGEQDGHLPVGQVELGPQRLDGAGREEGEPLVEQPDGDERCDQRQRGASEQLELPPARTATRSVVGESRHWVRA